MSNDFYNHDDGTPAVLSRGSSANMRGEFDSVQAGFNKMPSGAQMWSGSANYYTAGGTADAWTVSLPTNPGNFLTSYVDGMQLRVNFPAANATTTPTINVNGLGAKTIAGDAGNPLSAGDIAAGSVRTLTYSATLGKFVVFLGNSVASAAAQAAVATQQAQTATTQAGIATTQAGIATTQAGIATTQAGNSQTSATAAAGSATTASNASNTAVAASGSVGSYPNAYATTLPQGVTAINISNGGSGGTNGTGYAGGVSGGPTGFAWTYDIVGGVATNAKITNPGLSTSSTAPTLSFPNGSLGGTPAATATVGSVVANQKTYWAATSDGNFLALWQNNAGSIVAVNDPNGNQIKQPLSPLVLYPRPVSETVGTGITGSTGQDSTTYIQTWPTASTVDGFVSSISFQAPGNGYVRLYVYELVSGSQYKITRQFDFKVTSGLNTFNAPGDFDFFHLPPGSRIGGKVQSGGTNLLNQLTPTGSGKSRNFLTSDSTGVGALCNLLALDGTNDINTPSIQYTTVHPSTILANVLQQMYDMGAGRLQTAANVAAVRRGKKSLHRQYFPGTTTPTGWTIGTWTVNNGLVAPTTPGASTFAHWNTYVNANYMTITARFTVTDAATSQFGVYTNPTQNQYGGAWLVDAASSTLTAYYNSVTFNSLAAEPYNKTVGIPALVSGRDYLLTVRAQGLDVQLEWRDCTTGLVTTLTCPFTASTHDNCRGQPGVVYTAGAANGVTCKYFEVAPLFEAPKIVLVGDSNTWGGSIGPSGSSLKPLEWKSAWAYLLDAQRGRGDVYNGCRGGETSATWNASNMTDANVTPWSPDFWVIALGTNDTTQASWRTNMAAIIAACNARGGQVVLCTIPPKASGQALVDSMNADIKGGYFGTYPIIDFAFATSVNNDGSTQNTALFNADGIHMTIDGHAAVFNRLKADAPFLLQA